MNQKPRVGDLRVEECLDAELHRYVRTARLFDVTSAIYSDKLPELLDVLLMAMSPQAFTLAGFERVARVEYARMRSRGWWLRHSSTVSTVALRSSEA